MHDKLTIDTAWLHGGGGTPGHAARRRDRPHAGYYCHSPSPLLRCIMASIHTSLSLIGTSSRKYRSTAYDIRSIGASAGPPGPSSWSKTTLHTHQHLRAIHRTTIWTSDAGGAPNPRTRCVYPVPKRNC